MAWSILMSDADISSVTLAYTVPVGSEGRLSANFTNRSTSATATVTLWVVPSGETRGNEHLKESGTTLGLAGTSQATLERFFVVPTGGMVYVQASNASVSCQVSGDVVTPDTFGVTDGTSSITYGTGWTGAVASLKKDQNGRVSFNFFLSASSSPTNHLMTLPSGYRPSSTVDFASGFYYESGTSTPVAYSFSVVSTGVMNLQYTSGNLAIVQQAGDWVVVHGEFWT